MRQINTNFLWTAGNFERWILSNNNKTQQNKSNFSVKSSHVTWQVATLSLHLRSVTSYFKLLAGRFLKKKIDKKTIESVFVAQNGLARKFQRKILWLEDEMSIEEWSSGFDYGSIHFEHLAWSGRYRFGFWIETTKSYINSIGNHAFLEDFIFYTHHCGQFLGNPDAQRKMYSSHMDPVLYYLWYNPNFNNVCNTICKCPTKFHNSRVDHNYDIFLLLHHPIYCTMDLCGL